MRISALVSVLAVPALASAEPSQIKVGGATLSAAIGSDTMGEKLDELTLQLERGGKVVWKLKGVKAIGAGKAMPKLPDVCESYAVSVEAQRLDKRDGARIDIACRNGEDSFTARGVTLLVDTIDPYALLWLGAGDSVSNQNDACIDEHHVKFSLSGRKLAQDVVDTSQKNADGSCMPDGKHGKVKTAKKRVVIDL
jgi:hypothetical protein